MSTPHRSPTHELPDQEAVDEIVKRGPLGAAIVAFIATAAVVAIWFAFYAFVFVPRTSAP